MKNSKKSIIFIISTVLISFLIIGFSRFIFDNGFMKDRLNKNVKYYEGKVKRITRGYRARISKYSHRNFRGTRKGEGIWNRK